MTQAPDCRAAVERLQRERDNATAVPQVAADDV